MSAIKPNKAQFLELMEAPDEGPVTMLNLLKFKSDANGTGASGAGEYAKYGDAAIQMVEARGGKVLWMGRADQILIGDPTEDWDSVALVQYPSRKAFIEMVSNSIEIRARPVSRSEFLASAICPSMIAPRY